MSDNGAKSFHENQHQQKEKHFTLADSNEPHNQTEVAESYGITKKMNNYIRMANMIPEFEDLVDIDIVTKDTAFVMIRNHSSNAQQELISSMDVTS